VTAPSATTDASGTTSGILRIALVAPSGAPVLSADAADDAVARIEAAGPSVKAILLTHPGKNFCVGGDVAAFADAEQPGVYVGELAGKLHAAIRAIAAAPVPVVAAVQGWAAGAGMSMVAIADIAVAGTGTQFRAAYPSIGFTPDGGMSWSLPRAVGRSRALDIILTNRVVDAREAQAIGLVARVVADDRVQAEAEAIAASFLTGSAPALAGIKRLVNDGLHRNLPEQLDAESASIVARADSADGREGTRAFVDRRPPVFDQGSK
jgi:2-(1,2-epoxy-1,2-dihydrophenyl)acetyl-CoA isomerase